MADENTVKQACIEYLQYHGWLVLRINSGAGAGEYTIKPGRMPLAVETKAPGKLSNVSDAQSTFLNYWQSHGGLMVVCDSVDLLIEALQ